MTSSTVPTSKDLQFSQFLDSQSPPLQQDSLLGTLETRQNMFFHRGSPKRFHQWSPSYTAASQPGHHIYPPSNASKNVQTKIDFLYNNLQQPLAATILIAMILFPPPLPTFPKMLHSLNLSTPCAKIETLQEDKAWKKFGCVCFQGTECSLNCAANREFSQLLVTDYL